MTRILSRIAIYLLFVLAIVSALAQQNNTINTVAGGATYNSSATLTAIPNPTGIAEDASGNVYVVSQYSYYVYKVTPGGTLSVFAGTGIFGFGAENVPATGTPLTAAVAVGVDANSGNVYIVDGNRIRMVSNGNISTLANLTGTNCPHPTDLCGDGGPASQAQFFSPQAIYVNAAGNIFIADTQDQKIRFINMQSTAVTVTGQTVQPGNVATLAGNGETCNGPFVACGDGGLATAPGNSGAKLDLPQGLITDKAGNLYIGDTRDQRIRCVLNVAGGCPQLAHQNVVVGDIVTYAGSGQVCGNPMNSCNDGQPKLSGRFHNPAGLWVDGVGNLYIADQWDNKIREVTTGINGTVITVCGNGTPGSENGKCAKGVEFWGPLAIIFDGFGNAYVADSGNSLVRHGQIATGQVTTFAGSGLVGDNGPATLATLANPVGVTWDPAGVNYYIVDNGNNRIREVTADGNIQTVAGNGHPSQPSPGSIGDNGPATQATLSNPNGVAVDGAGNLYIADTDNAVVRVVNMQSAPITVAGKTIQPGQIDTVAGQTGVGGCEPATAQCGDGGPATGPDVFMDYPIAVSVDGSGNFYVADYYDNRVRCILNLTGGCPNTNYTDVGVGDIVTYAGTGSGGKQGNGAPADTASLHYPDGIAANAVGDLQIADTLNNEVRCVAGVNGGCQSPKAQAAYIYDYAFNGQPRFSGDGGPAKSASMHIPKGVALDPSGNLYVGGGADVVVQRIDAPTQTVITVAGDPLHPGNVGFAGDGGLSIQATLDNLGLSVNGSEQLLIADHGNNRVRMVDMVPVPALWNRKLVFPDTPVGQSSQPMQAKLQNAGLASLPISSTMLGGDDPQDFSVKPNTCVTQLSPGPGTQSFCYVTVTFTPTQTGQRTATVTVNTSMGPQLVNLIGTGD